jgi:hypothetical protein
MATTKTHIKYITKNKFVASADACLMIHNPSPNR